MPPLFQYIKIRLKYYIDKFYVTQDCYIGDAIELDYTIKTTGADDAIVHI